MANTYKSPVLAVTSDGQYVDTRNTPFSRGTQKVVFNTQFEPPANPGTTAFTKRFRLTEPLRGVKLIKLLYVSFPLVNESAGGLGDGTDNLFIINIKEINGSFISTHPPKINGNVSNSFMDTIEGSFAVLQNNVQTFTPALANLPNTFFYENQANYDISQYFSTPIDLVELNFSFSNSRGIEIGYAKGANANVNQVILCFEIIGQGAK